MADFELAQTKIPTNYYVSTDIWKNNTILKQFPKIDKQTIKYKTPEQPSIEISQ
jgi:hypothetical protein